MTGGDYEDYSYGVRSIDVDEISRTFENAGGSYSGDGSEFVRMYDGREYIDRDAVRLAADRAAEEASDRRNAEMYMRKLMMQQQARPQGTTYIEVDGTQIYFPINGKIQGARLVHNVNCPHCFKPYKFGPYLSYEEGFVFVKENAEYDVCPCPFCGANDIEWSGENLKIRNTIANVLTTGQYHLWNYKRPNYKFARHILFKDQEADAFANTPAARPLKSLIVERFGITREKSARGKGNDYKITIMCIGEEEPPQSLGGVMVRFALKRFRHTSDTNIFRKMQPTAKTEDYDVVTARQEPCFFKLVGEPKWDEYEQYICTYEAKVTRDDKEGDFADGIYMSMLDIAGMRMLEGSACTYRKVPAAADAPFSGSAPANEPYYAPKKTSASAPKIAPAHEQYFEKSTEEKKVKAPAPKIAPAHEQYFEKSTEEKKVKTPAPKIAPAHEQFFEKSTEEKKSEEKKSEENKIEEKIEKVQPVQEQQAEPVKSTGDCRNYITLKEWTCKNGSFASKRPRMEGLKFVLMARACVIDAVINVNTPMEIGADYYLDTECSLFYYKGGLFNKWKSLFKGEKKSEKKRQGKINRQLESEYPGQYTYVLRFTIGSEELEQKLVDGRYKVDFRIIGIPYLEGSTELADRFSTK